MTKHDICCRTLMYRPEHDPGSQHAERGEGLYALDSKAMAALHPDVIVTQDLCAVCAVDLKAVQRCAATARIVSLNPFTL